MAVYDRESMEQFCPQMDLSLSTASPNSPNQVGSEALAVSVDPFYSDSNIRYLEGLMEDVKAGRAQFVRHDLIAVD